MELKKKSQVLYQDILSNTIFCSKFIVLIKVKLDRLKVHVFHQNGKLYNFMLFFSVSELSKYIQIDVFQVDDEIPLIAIFLASYKT
jgi:hypothetical protein